MQVKEQLERISTQIAAFGKENLADILHLLVGTIPHISRRHKARIYLEDLSTGSLYCYKSASIDADSPAIREFSITSQFWLVSQVYRSQEILAVPDIREQDGFFPEEFIDKSGVLSGYLLPIVYKGRSIGVICLDSDRKNAIIPQGDLHLLRDFLDRTASMLERTRKYHQQLVLACRVDEAKKKEAAYHMVKSAALLVDKLALASVLIPCSLDDALGELQILATYSKEPEAQAFYAEDERINLQPGESLLSNYINSSGVIVDDTLLSPIYFPDLSAESLQKRYLTDELGLKSLYAVPRYDRKTRQIICMVNYYTKEDYRFSPFELGLLDAHAEMAQRAIQEIGNEHMEIQVLAEINDLLLEKFSGPQPFLNRILAKATELIGADTGSIALIRQVDGQRWLYVEETDGSICGAKSKEWLKKNIPPIRVGSVDLPEGERSLTGHVAATGKPHIVADTHDEREVAGLYRELVTAIRSEIAVPIVSDEEVMAVICLDSFKPGFFTGEHRRLLEIIARMISRQLSALQQIETLTSEVNLLRKDVDYRDPKISSYRLGNIIGNASASDKTIKFIQQITGPLANRISLWQQGGYRETVLGLPSILVTGETGSGKEFIFNNIYSRLNELFRAKGQGKELPLKKTNIAAYSGDLTYSELFGHKRGAFTGAHADRKGILEEADGGVVFLDEIGDADPKTQVQLLRFLDNGGFVRLGENSTRYARVLLIAATNKNLSKLIEEGSFRADLYHRLTELKITVPSLNQRREDIVDLATHFLGQLWRVYQVPAGSSEPPTISDSAQELIAAHHYTGNIRELRSILLRALFLCRNDEITAADIEQGLPVNPSGQGQQESSTTQAEGLYQQIVDGETDFWQAAYSPFSEGEVSKEAIRELIAIARRNGATSLPKIALELGACDPKSEDEEEKKQFFRFKNFLYKTVKIS